MSALMADAVLVVHALFVAFVVLSVPLIFLGGWRGWRWVRAPFFRVSHLLAILFVVVQSWLGQVCPLTRWESMLRHASGQTGYQQGFIADWLHHLLFFSAPAWVFVASYSVFALLVVWAWRRVPPAFR